VVTSLEFWVLVTFLVTTKSTRTSHISAVFFPSRFLKLSTRRKQSYILYLMSDWWVFVQSVKLSPCSFQRIWHWSKIPSEHSAIALEIRDLLSESRNINMSLKWLCTTILLCWLLQDLADKFILLKKKKKKKKWKERKKGEWSVVSFRLFYSFGVWQRLCSGSHL
jgi:hypothetical protein